MNLIDATVVAVLSTPYEKYNKWWVDVNCVDMGGESKTNLMFDTIEEAEKVGLGYQFLH